MKKLLLLMGILTMCGCGISDRTYISEYTYINETEWDIEMTIVFEKRQETHNILMGKSILFTYTDMGGFPRPFSYPHKYTLIVSNGERKKEFIDDLNAGVLNQDNYNITKTKKGGGVRYFEYIFKPSFFDDADPIE